MVAYEVIAITVNNSTGEPVVFKIFKAAACVSINDNSMSWHETRLNKYTPYRITVAGITRKGFGNATDGIIVVTDEDSKYINMVQH